MKSLHKAVVIILPVLLTILKAEAAIVYETSSGDCENDCDFHGYQYQWCYTNQNKGTWSHCSSKPGYTSGNDECRLGQLGCFHHGYGFYWCYKKGGGWDYCSKVHVYADAEWNQDNERIVKNYEEIWKGFSVDYRYNESTNAESSGGTSVPGCPKSIEGFPFVLHGTPPKCYLAGHQSPCWGNQILFTEPRSSFGTCNCECFEDDGMFDFNKTKICPALDRQPAFAYYAKSRKCHPLFEQGPCKDGQWLVPAEEDKNDLRCENRKCPEGAFPEDEAKRRQFYQNEYGYIHDFFSKNYKAPYDKRCMELQLIGSTLRSNIHPNECHPIKEKYSLHLDKCIPRRVARFTLG